jgi:hypothetical protein
MKRTEEAKVEGSQLSGAMKRTEEAKFEGSQLTGAEETEDVIE